MLSIVPDEGIAKKSSKKKIGRHPLTAITLTQFTKNVHNIWYAVKNGVFWDVTPCGFCKNRRF
jgi:hypothetical protein